MIFNELIALVFLQKIQSTTELILRMVSIFPFWYILLSSGAGESITNPLMLFVSEIHKDAYFFVDDYSLVYLSSKQLACTAI